MNGRFMPSAQHIAAVKIALAIYYDQDIEHLLEAEVNLPNQRNRFDRERHKFWSRIQMKVVEKLSFLPASMKIIVSKLIRPIHMEACKWACDHGSIFKLTFPSCYLIYKSFICWKSDGTINKLQTAKKLIGDKNVDIQTRFAVACTYFFEEEVSDLWFEDSEDNLMSIPRRGRNLAVRFWMEYLKKGIWKKKYFKKMINVHIQTHCLRQVAIPLRMSCFFPYLSSEKKKKCLPYAQPYAGYAHNDDLLLCIDAMDETEREESLSTLASSILCCYLEWPLQSLFMDIANQVCSHMDDVQFLLVFFHILEHCLLKGYDDFDYLGLFKEFWGLVPASTKNELEEYIYYFKMIEAALNYDEETASLSLPETLDALFVDMFSKN